jgi:hypothetical protein
VSSRLVVVETINFEVSDCAVVVVSGSVIVVVSGCCSVSVHPVARNTLNRTIKIKNAFLILFSI